MNQNCSQNVKDLRIKKAGHCFHLALCHKSLGISEFLLPMWDENDKKIDPSATITEAVTGSDWVILTARIANISSGTPTRFEDTSIKCSEVTYIQTQTKEEEINGN